MPKQKACKKCKAVHTLAKCPKCGTEEFSDSFKGKVLILDPEQSEISKRLKIKEKGEYAIKT